jgi:hypothetical protein
MTRHAQQELLPALEDAVKQMLKAEIEPAERIKLIDVGAKLLMIKHKLEQDDTSGDGSFFGKGK